MTGLVAILLYSFHLVFVDSKTFKGEKNRIFTQKHATSLSPSLLSENPVFFLLNENKDHVHRHVKGL